MIRKDFALLVLITLLALFLRVSFSHHSFWVDEFSSADQARLLLANGLSVFRDPSIFFEYHNITTYSLIALFFSIFGESTWSARLPLMLIGSLVPGSIYLLAKEEFDRVTAFGASLLAVFSYFFITWSRQARGYAILQLLVLILFWLYRKWLLASNTQQSNKYSIGLAAVIILGALTHVFFYLAIASLIIHGLVFYRKKIKELLLRPSSITFLFFLVTITLGTGLWATGQKYIQLALPLGFQNNLKYYHSFLWREYGLISFLGGVGIIIAILKKKIVAQLLFIHLLISMVFLSFVFSPRVSRYLLPLFPAFFVGTSYLLTLISQKIVLPKNHWFILKKFGLVLPIGLIMIIIINGHKFTLFPKQFFSVNHDFREIALIDYDQVYNLISKKSSSLDSKPAVIDTWPDRSMWYLGRDYPALFAFRWSDQGLMKQTPHYINRDGEKVIIKKENVKLVTSLPDLLLVMKKHHTGFIWIDDVTLPQEVIDFARENFKHELYLERYTLEDNPLSSWPGDLYSWGIDHD